MWCSSAGKELVAIQSCVYNMFAKRNTKKTDGLEF